MNPNGVCKGCACVAASRACTNCRPGQVGRCCNSSFPNTHDAAIPSNNSEMFGQESTNHHSATISLSHSPPTPRYTPQGMTSGKSRVAPIEKKIIDNNNKSYIYIKKPRYAEEYISDDIIPPGLEGYAHGVTTNEDYISEDIFPPGLGIHAHEGRINEDYISEDIIPQVEVDCFFNKAVGESIIWTTPSCPTHPKTDNYWYNLWEEISCRPVRLYTIPHGQIGKAYVNTLSELTRELAGGTISSEKLLLFSAIVLHRDRDIRKAAGIRAAVERRLQQWHAERFNLLVEDLLRTHTQHKSQHHLWIAQHYTENLQN
eukprot:GHVR01128369.1.p1 GENE.GHVR01128369.1~~GHVR01128369.1.p1  ORF type:complete len:315 (+),score=34.45 GHVR01128369.1:167-1111(+)